MTSEEATKERITGMMQAMQQRGIDHGTRVRCPECNAGIGKYCRVDMRDTREAKSSSVILHETRVALQRETLGDLTPDAIYS